MPFVAFSCNGDGAGILPEAEFNVFRQGFPGGTDAGRQSPNAHHLKEYLGKLKN